MLEHIDDMKTLAVRLTEALAAEIEAESRERKISKSDVVRERLQRAGRSARRLSCRRNASSCPGAPAKPSYPRHTTFWDRAARALGSLLRRRAVVAAFRLGSDLESVPRRMEKYALVPMSLASGVRREIDAKTV